MTETLSERLRAAALLDAHFAVPAERDDLVLLLHDAAEDLDAIRQRAETALVAGPQPSARAAVDAWMDVFVARSQYFEDTLTKANDKIRDLKRDCIDAGLALQGMRQDNETLRKMLVHAGEQSARDLAARRAFLEQAVCHPGPPLSETEDYDPEAPVGELEAAILERLDHETEDRRELWDIRTLCEAALGRTPDPARTTIQVVRDLLAQPTTMQRLNEQCRDRRAAERAAAGIVPVVRPEHFSGPFPAISGYVKRTQAARAATIDQALRMLKPGQSLAVHDEPERVDILFLDPGQYPPLGQTWTVYGPLVLDDQLAGATGSEIHQDAIAAHIQAHGGNPAATTVAQIADAMNATDPNFTYKPNAAGNGLDATPVPREGVGGTIRIVGGDPEALASLGLPDPEPLRPTVAAGMATLRANSADRSPGPHPKAEEWQKLIDGLRNKHGGALNSPETRARIQGDIAGFMASIKDAPPVPAVTLDEAGSDFLSGKVAFKVRIPSELAAEIERLLASDDAARVRRIERGFVARQIHTPGSPVVTTAPAVGNLPAETLTPEEEAEREERLERFDHDWD